jgi:hypothetical protein
VTERGAIRARAPSRSPSRLASLELTQRGAPELALRQHRQVVHPAVVRPQLAAPHDHQIRDHAGEVGARPPEIVDEQRQRELDLARRRAQQLRNPDGERDEIDPGRRRLELGERKPSRREPELVAVRPSVQRELQQPLGPGQPGERAEHRIRRRSRHPPHVVGRHLVVEPAQVGRGALAGRDRDKPQQDLPLGWALRRPPQHRGL